MTPDYELIGNDALETTPGPQHQPFTFRNFIQCETKQTAACLLQTRHPTAKTTNVT